MKLKKIIKCGAYALASSLILTSCQDDDNPTTTQNTLSLTSNLDGMDVSSLNVPTTYDTASSFSPAAWSGQETRKQQLNELVGYSKNTPISFDLGAALSDGSLYVNDGATSSTNIYAKIDENITGAKGTIANYAVANLFVAIADSLKEASAEYATTATNGVGGLLDGRHFSSTGIEYAQLLEKGLFGACFYDQIVDDYLEGAATGTSKTNTAEDEDYDTEGTSRQHAFDEAFGYLGVSIDWDGTSGSAEDLGKYIDKTSDDLDVDISSKLAYAFRVGRAALKAGETATTGDNTNEKVLTAAIADIKTYVEAGIAGSAIGYLNSTITKKAANDEAGQLHAFSEALAFIFSLTFNDNSTIPVSKVYEILDIFSWSDESLEGVYDVNAWDVTNDDLNKALEILETYYPELSEVAF